MIDRITSYYTLVRSRRVLRQSYRLYRRKRRSLAAMQKEQIEGLIEGLRQAIVQKQPQMAKATAESLELAVRHLMPKTGWDQIRDLFGALLFALIVAVVVRQMWFEPYTIPSGSMRPTLKERDFLLVSKTDFGLDTVMRTGHFHFNPELVKRGSIVIFTSQNMDIPDTDTMDFYILPGKKQMVKRLIGKPGDTVYFYGGHIYGLDAAGHDLVDLREPSWFQGLEHIPMIRFDGKARTAPQPSQGVFSPVVFHQMNEPVAILGAQHQVVHGEMLYPKGNPVAHYYDLWGMKNYAMARLLPGDAKAPLYLELTHHPTLAGAKVERDEFNRLRPELAMSVSSIPLDAGKIDALMSHMYTSRFTLKDGIAYRTGSPFSHASYLPRMKQIPDGTYEIQDGKAYRVLWGGITLALADDHPLLSRDPAHVQLLYNLGIEFHNEFNTPHARQNHIFPARYAYFRGGDLYLLGAPIFGKNDPTLLSFLEREHQRHNQNLSYASFEDAGSPFNEKGEIDAAFIRQHGLSVPPNMYLVLGDNHANSGDSRQFGFVPQENLRGGASFLFWPFDERWGRLPQPSISHFSFPNLFVWISFFIIMTASTLYFRRKYARPLPFE